MQGVAQFLWQAGGVLAFGSGLFLWRAGVLPQALQPWQQWYCRGLAIAGLAALVAGTAFLVTQGLEIFGSASGWRDARWPLLVTHSRLGQVWLVKQLLLLAWIAAMLGSAHAAGRGLHRAGTVIGAAFLLVGPWAGHGGASEPVALVMPLHALHALLAGGWLGGLVAWAALVRSEADVLADGYLGRALAAFSRFAMAAMICLAATGALIAWRQFGSWPALFGTTAGALLAAKLAALAIALACAWRLRRRHLEALFNAPSRMARGAALRLFAVEAAAAVVVFWLALALTRVPPGAHQEVYWWLPFRLVPPASGSVPLASWQDAVGWGGLGIAVAAAPLYLSRHRRTALVALLGGLAMYGAVLAVPATTATYLRAGVAYGAPSISRGATLYGARCASCHGAGGRGSDTALGAGLAPPADLARHAAMHTAGDMYEWLSAGTPRGMPGFADLLSAEARWDLINFLRAFSDGHVARILGPRIEPGRPWLTAPNFSYETADGNRGELKDSRGLGPVLLVFAAAGDGASAPTGWRALIDASRATGVAALVVPTSGDCSSPSLRRGPCVAYDAPPIVTAYRLMSRTLLHPGARDTLGPELTSAAFLIDRRGYVRARWLPVDAPEPWSPGTLRSMLAGLAAEPPGPPAPDEHVH
ncbi:MAG: CopD family protein [Gammaproteobacteria bacterium]